MFSKKIKAAGAVRTALALAGLAFSAASSAIPYAIGDVFASTGSGLVNVFSQTGVLKQTLNTGLGGFTTGSTFDKFGNFYVTAFSANRVSQFDSNGALVNANWATGISRPESIVFDLAGDAYIGNAGASQIQKVNAAGTQINVFNTLQNTDWIDLKADQTTLLYSNEGSVIRELNTSTLVDTVFNDPGAFGALFAKRYLADGGVLAASGTGNVFRWDANGVLIDTLAAGIGGVFALNLDPNGSSFWTGALGGQQVVKRNIGTNALEESWSTGTGQLFGLSVFGEVQAGGGGGGGGGGNGNIPEPGALSLIALGIAGLGFLRRRKALSA